MKYYLFFLLILITLSPLSSSDREIALVYQEKVWEFIEKDSDKTWELLESAFAYDNRLSGLWCARESYWRLKMILPERLMPIRGL
jgi:hypothetical protein